MNKSKYYLRNQFILIILLILYLLISCSIEKPSAPNYYLPLQIPVINEIYTMNDFAEDEDEIKIDQDQEQIIYSIEQNIDAFSIGSYLKTDLREIEKSIQIGNTQNDSIPIPDHILVKEASIKTGKIEITVTNPFSYKVQISALLPDIYTLNNSVLSKDKIEINQSSTKLIEIDLSGYKYCPPVYQNTNFFRYKLTAEAINETPPPDDRLNLNLTLSSLRFSSITGIFNNLEVSIDTTKKIKFPKEIEDMVAQSAELILTIYNGVGIPANVNFEINGINNNGEQAAPLLINGDILPSTNEGNMVSTVLIVTELEKVTDFINKIPTDISINGKMYLNTGADVVTITEFDSIKGNILFQIPLTFSIGEFSKKSKIDTLIIDKYYKRKIENHLMEGQLQIKIKNHLPLGIEVQLFFSKDNTTLFEKPDFKSDIFYVPAGQCENDPNEVLAASVTTHLQNLTKEKIGLLTEPILFRAVEVRVPGTHDQLVRIKPSDYVEILATASIMVHVKNP